MEKIFRFWPQVAICAITFAFFLRLFFPPSLFVNPDYGRSDIIDFNFPIKVILANSLKNFQIPLWEPKLGQGYPFFEEGQIGTFYLPNLILFYFFPTWLAFNLGYVTTFLLASFSAYLLARSFGIGKSGSFVAGITFAYSALFVLHIHHYNLIQTASITPWLFWATNEFFKTKRILYLTLISLFLSQQIFTGFPQITTYTLIGLVIFIAYKSHFEKTKLHTHKMTIIALTIAILFGFAIGSVQIAATYNLTLQTGRLATETPQKILTDFPMKFSNLKTIVNPFILGNPKNATYPFWQPGKWGIFWESNLYFGIIQLILIICLLITLVKKREKTFKSIIFWVLFASLGLMLALGYLAPLHPIFSIPPFSLFRVPSRFLIFTFLAASILSAFAIEKLLKIKAKKAANFLVIITLAITSIDIFRTWYSYHLIGDKNEWLKPPEIASAIPKDSRIFTIGQVTYMNNAFKNYGWQNQEETYLFLKNLVSQNSNIIYGNSHMLAYAGMYPKRGSLIVELLNQNLKENNKEIVMNDEALKLLNLSSAGHLIVYKKISSEKLQLLKNIKFENYEIFLYKNSQALPLAYTVRDFRIATTLQQAQKILESQDFDPLDSVILEEEINISKTPTKRNNQITIIERQPTKIKLKADFETDGIMVLAQTFYHGWSAKIDVKDTKIFPANINSNAIIVPAGKHQIEFNYRPNYLYTWGPISLVSIIILLTAMLKYRKTTVN